MDKLELSEVFWKEISLFPGILIGCEVLAACQRDAACIEAVVYRFNLEYCFPGESLDAKARIIYSARNIFGLARK